jgi:hypothetical protein
MFGYTASNTARFGWFWPDFFFGLECVSCPFPSRLDMYVHKSLTIKTLRVMGMIIGAVASALYLVDAHPDIAIESFTCLLLSVPPSPA